MTTPQTSQLDAITIVALLTAMGVATSASVLVVFAGLCEFFWRVIA
jgi:hypothetical protein